MDPRVSILTLVSAVLAALTRALNVDTTFATWSKKLRAIVLVTVGTAQAIVDNMVAGTAVQSAVLAALTTTAPSFVILLVEWLSELKGNAGKPGGGGAVDAGTHLVTPLAGKSVGPYSAGIVAVGMAVLAILILPGCTVSLEQAHRTALSNRAVAELAAVPYSPDSQACASLDSQHRTWGALAELAGVLAGAGGIATLPIPDDQKVLRTVDATAALAFGAFAAAAVFIEQDAASSWARDCTGSSK